MSARILEIEKYKHANGYIAFAGTLRNERKFELFQNVFIQYSGKMCQCKIVGVELPPTDNPDYIYKIQIPEEFIEDKELRVSYTCTHIFSSIDEAKKSALKEAKSKYDLNKSNIENFFKTYEK